MTNIEFRIRMLEQNFIRCIAAFAGSPRSKSTSRQNRQASTLPKCYEHNNGRNKKNTDKYFS